jgi:hypothetical protein
MEGTRYLMAKRISFTTSLVASNRRRRIECVCSTTLYLAIENYIVVEEVYANCLIIIHSSITSDIITLRAQMTLLTSALIHNIADLKTFFRDW